MSMFKNTRSAFLLSLKKIHARTGLPLSSLVLSFTLLHEITSIVPFVGFLCAGHAYGVGEKVVAAVVLKDKEMDQSSWVHQQVHSWIVHGESIAQRYPGVFGVEKQEKDVAATPQEAAYTGRISGNVANLIFAYGLTKILLPARLGLCLYLTPAFSRKFVEPIRTIVIRTLRRQ